MQARRIDALLFAFVNWQVSNNEKKRIDLFDRPVGLMVKASASAAGDHIIIARESPNNMDHKCCLQVHIDLDA